MRDLTDKEWTLIAPPKRDGDKGSVDLRAVIDGFDVRAHGLPVAGAAKGSAAALDGGMAIWICGMTTPR